MLTPEKHDVLKLIGMVAYMLLERWLGRTKMVEQNSVIDLVVATVLKLKEKLK